jgi:hypothetical protein
VKKHIRQQKTDATITKLAMLLVTAGNRNSKGGIPVVIPRQLAEDIHALAWDANRHVARKAQLDTAVTA